jgi:hypothetical protein
MMIRSDPFRDVDRWMDEFRFGARERTMPMDASGMVTNSYWTLMFLVSIPTRLI